MKKSKCKICGKYEIRNKVVKETENFDIKIAEFHQWKWCKFKNNWCRCVAGNCGEVIEKTENKIEGETNEIL